MNEKEKLSPESFLKKFSKKDEVNKLKHLKITSSQVSDALYNLTGNSGAIEGVMPLFDVSVLGKVVTVDTNSDDWGTCVKAIDTAKKGEILFIHVNDDNKAVWGELTSKTAKNKGIIATIIYGAVRDVKAIKELKYPVFSKNIVPNAGNPKADGKINISVKCGELIVNPYDIIIADECGVVVIPKEHMKNIINETLKIKKNEENIIKGIEQGKSLSSIIGLK